jgi:hypothetical protein
MEYGWVGATFTVDKNLNDNQPLSHMRSINALKSQRFQVIDKLTF